MGIYVPIAIAWGSLVLANTPPGLVTDLQLGRFFAQFGQVSGGGGHQPR